jgi:hypothetical protein
LLGQEEDFFKLFERPIDFFAVADSDNENHEKAFIENQEVSRYPSPICIGVDCLSRRLPFPLICSISDNKWEFKGKA